MYQIIFSEKLEKKLQKMPLFVKKGVQKWVAMIMATNNPYYNAKHLKGELKGYWRYRIGDYRLIYIIRENVIIIRVIRVEHRSTVYDNLPTLEKE